MLVHQRVSHSCSCSSAVPVGSGRKLEAIECPWSRLERVASKVAGKCPNDGQGLVNVPFWEDWTSPYSSHYRPMVG